MGGVARAGAALRDCAVEAAAAGGAGIDVRSLPVNEEVLAFRRKARAHGGEVWPVSGRQEIVDRSTFSLRQRARTEGCEGPRWTICDMAAVQAFDRFMPLLPTAGLAARIFRFAVINLLGLCLSVATTMTFASAVLPAIRWRFQPDIVANLFGVAVPAFPSYFGHKFSPYR